MKMDLKKQGEGVDQIQQVRIWFGDGLGIKLLSF
jgi:hypothetical protein